MGKGEGGGGGGDASHAGTQTRGYCSGMPALPADLNNTPLSFSLLLWKTIVKLVVVELVTTAGLKLMISFTT